jgi:hypothetical protein
MLILNKSNQFVSITAKKDRVGSVVCSFLDQKNQLKFNLLFLRKKSIETEEITNISLVVMLYLIY